MWDERLKLYDQIVAGSTRFRRKGKTMPYTSANGYMFSMLNKEGELGIRLPKGEAQKFRDEHHSPEPFKSHGAVMRDYVKVPEPLLKKPEEVLRYIEGSYDYVMLLPTK